MSTKTWSVSRFRFYEEDTGPRPIRRLSSWEDVWAIPVLRLRELRQVMIGNLLLQFALTIACCQLIARNVAIVEHPTEAPTRCNVLPPSIWRLPCTRLLCKHPSACQHRIYQGLFGAVAPKPTTLLIICPSPLQRTVALILEHGKTRMALPSALVMGRSEDGLYRTSPLKRYPNDLCRTLARLAVFAAEAAPRCSADAVDDIEPLATYLEEVYQQSERTSDGADFFQGWGVTPTN